MRVDRVLAHRPEDPLDEPAGEKQRDDAEANCRDRRRRPPPLAPDVARCERKVAQKVTGHSAGHGTAWPLALSMRGFGGGQSLYAMLVAMSTLAVPGMGKVSGPRRPAGTFRRQLAALAFCLGWQEPVGPSGPGSRARPGWVSIIRPISMAMGAVVENLAQAADALGLPAEALAVGRGGAHEPFATIKCDGPVRLPGGEREAALFRRHTNRGAFQTAPLDPTLVARLAAMTEGPCAPSWCRRANRRSDLRPWCESASEVRFQTEEIHRWLGGSLRFTPEEVERGDGLDVATLLLPPGAVGLLKLSLDWRRMAVLNRFGAYKLFAFLEAAMLQQSAALLLVAGPAQGVGVEVAAGRLLERLWVTLNDQGRRRPSLLRAFRSVVPAPGGTRLRSIRRARHRDRAVASRISWARPTRRFSCCCGSGFPRSTIPFVPGACRRKPPYPCRIHNDGEQGHGRCQEKSIWNGLC